MLRRWSMWLRKGISSRAVPATSLALAALTLVGAPSSARAQWSRTYEQFYLPGNFNWTFRREYAVADRLFNAFDYGHAILYERLYTRPGAPVGLLETDEYNFITQKLLVRPPDLPLEEAAIEINYAKLAPEAKAMFDWAHLLHRQIYDVLASENMTEVQKDAKVAELVAYYKTRPDLAFSSVPKNMDLMEGQPYSLAFRLRYPKFNGLIWGYHWLQVGLYEPLMIGKTREERQAGVTAAVARFRQMLDSAPEHMPRIMPMTAAIAPTFAARYPEASIIFDNLHAMHDVVSDILTNNEKVPRNRKRAAILEAASRYRDATSFPMSIAEWKSMGEMMGIDNMGGPAVGFLAAWPTPTLPRGASMAEAMKGMQHGAPRAMPGMPGMTHGADSAAAKGGMPGMPAMPGMSHGAGGMQHDMKDMDQPDKAPEGIMSGMPGMKHDAAPAAEHAHTRATSTTGKSVSTGKKSSSSRSTSVKRKARAKKVTPAKKQARTKAAPPKAAPMDHSRMPGMKMPSMNP